MEELTAIAPSYWTKFQFIAAPNTTYQTEQTLDAISCYSPPFWAHILRSVSKLLLTLNASVGCFVYCMICSQFRGEMSNCFTNLMYSINNIIRATWTKHFLLHLTKWRTMAKLSILVEYNETSISWTESQTQNLRIYKLCLLHSETRSSFQLYNSKHFVMLN